MEGGFREAAGGEETAVVLEGQSHAEPHDGQPASSSLLFSLFNERARYASLPMFRMNREPADVETILLLVPEDSSGDHPTHFDEGAPAKSQMLDDRRRSLFQGSGRGNGRPRLRRKGEPHQSRDGRGVTRRRGASGPAVAARGRVGYDASEQRDR